MYQDFFILSHTDMDGYASAALTAVNLEKLYPDLGDFTNRLTNNCLFLNYPTEFPYNKIPENGIVIITDTSFTVNTENVLREICNKSRLVYWIDHHESSQSILYKIKDIKNLKYLVNNNLSGAGLTYSFFRYIIKSGIDICSSDVLMDKINLIYDNDFPEFVRYVDDYDRWVHKYEESNYLMYGINTCDKNIYIDLAQNTLSSLHTMKTIIEKGKIIFEYVKNNNKSIYDKNHYVIDVEYDDKIGKVKMACINAYGNSFIFDDDIYKFDLCCIYNYNGISKEWKYSIYTNDIAVSKGIKANTICERYGGGGHAKAAGFTSKALVFTK